jgi:hypothetical protein
LTPEPAFGIGIPVFAEPQKPVPPHSRSVRLLELFKKIIPLTLCVLLFGCASNEQKHFARDGRELKKNEREIHFESNPPGARIFYYAGVVEGGSQDEQHYCGTTPCDWVIEGNGDGTFKFPGALLVSMVYPPYVVFTAQPTPGATNQFIQKQIFRGGTIATPAAKIPGAIYFEMSKAQK